MLRISQEFPEKYFGNILKKIQEFSGTSWEKLRRKSQEFLQTNSQNSDSLKITQFGDQFQRISQEFLRNQSQEFVLKKFPGNSSKQVTKLRELGEIHHVCYLEIDKKILFTNLSSKPFSPDLLSFRSPI